MATRFWLNTRKVCMYTDKYISQSNNLLGTVK
jgi:hypothetical protein